MQQVAILTPQNVEIDFPVADLGKRIIAKAIDYIIVFALFLVLSEVFSSMIEPKLLNTDGWTITAIFIIIFFPAYAYTLIFETLLRGQTPGKLIMKLQVMRMDGQSFSWENALIRWMFTIIDYLPSMGIVGFISISVTKNNQRLGDLASGTVVINKKKEIGIDQTILLELNEQYQPVYSQVIRLSDNDMRIIKDSFENAQKHRDFKTIQKLRKKIESVIGMQDTNATDFQFIETVMKDFNYYTNR